MPQRVNGEQNSRTAVVRSRGIECVVVNDSEMGGMTQADLAEIFAHFNGGGFGGAFGGGYGGGCSSRGGHSHGFSF